MGTLLITPATHFSLSVPLWVPYSSLQPLTSASLSHCGYLTHHSSHSLQPLCPTVGTLLITPATHFSLSVRLWVPYSSLQPLTSASLSHCGYITDHSSHSLQPLCPTVGTLLITPATHFSLSVPLWVHYSSFQPLTSASLSHCGHLTHHSSHSLQPLCPTVGTLLITPATHFSLSVPLWVPYSSLQPLTSASLSHCGYLTHHSSHSLQPLRPTVGTLLITPATHFSPSVPLWVPYSSLQPLTSASLSHCGYLTHHSSHSLQPLCPTVGTLLITPATHFNLSVPLWVPYSSLQPLTSAPPSHCGYLTHHSSHSLQPLCPTVGTLLITPATHFSLSVPLWVPYSSLQPLNSASLSHGGHLTHHSNHSLQPLCPTVCTLLITPATHFNLSVPLWVPYSSLQPLISASLSHCGYLTHHSSHSLQPLCLTVGTLLITPATHFSLSVPLWAPYSSLQPLTSASLSHCGYLTHHSSHSLQPLCPTVGTLLITPATHFSPSVPLWVPYSSLQPLTSASPSHCGYLTHHSSHSLQPLRPTVGTLLITPATHFSLSVPLWVPYSSLQPLTSASLSHCGYLTHHSSHSLQPLCPTVGTLLITPATHFSLSVPLWTPYSSLQPLTSASLSHCGHLTHHSSHSLQPLCPTVGTLLITPATHFSLSVPVLRISWWSTRLITGARGTILLNLTLQAIIISINIPF